MACVPLLPTKMWKPSGEDTDVSPVPFIEVTNPVDSGQWTQVFQPSHMAQRSRFTAGFFYYYRDIDSGTRTDLSGVPDFFPIKNNTVTHDKTDSWSVYGQYDFDLSDQLSLVSGLRYTKEKREFNMVVTDDSGILPNPAFEFSKATAGDLTEHDTDNLTYRFELNWKPSDDVLWFGSVSRGIK